MIDRLLTPRLLHSLRNFPAIGLVGPRQVGKTTLARVIGEQWPTPVLHLDLERPTDLAKLSDPELFLARYEDHLVVIDEIQQRPDLFPLLRVLIDNNRRPGRFLVLGSATPALKRQASESLAGRIVYHELAPFTVGEVGGDKPGTDSQDKLWVRGGYPESYLSSDDDLSFQWRENFIQTHLERDLPLLGVRVAATTLRRFWTMVAHCHGQSWNASRIAESMGIDHKTSKHYLDILSDTFMLRQLQPCYANLGKRLVKAAKVYIRCPGLLHSLLRIGDWEALQGHPMRGHSWEGFCIEQILTSIPDHWDVGFYRTRSGAEMDLVIYPVAMQPPIAVEIKASTAPRLKKGNWIARTDLAPRRMFVVYPGEERYPIADDVEVLPASQIARIAEA